MQLHTEIRCLGGSDGDVNVHVGVGVALGLSVAAG